MCYAEFLSTNDSASAARGCKNQSSIIRRRALTEIKGPEVGAEWDVQHFLRECDVDFVYLCDRVVLEGSQVESAMQDTQLTAFVETFLSAAHLLEPVSHCCFFSAGSVDAEVVCMITTVLTFCNG